jgi:outer membrane receptor protein involved in Fe transport
MLFFGTAAGRLSNPELQWEEQTAFDIGIDARLFGSKLDLTVDYFNRRTDKLLLVPQVSGILGVGGPGAGAPIVNAGSVENKGWEFSFTYKQLVTDDFDFNVSFNLTTLENEAYNFMHPENTVVCQVRRSRTSIDEFEDEEAEAEEAAVGEGEGAEATAEAPAAQE